ncbi:MAG: hypothetical protein WAK92_03225 [Thiobacillus sp.]
MARKMLNGSVDKTDAKPKTMQLTVLSFAIALALALSAASVDAVASDKPRLKFRSKGPVCSCTSGMSEADISKAMAERFAKSEGAQLDTLDARPETRDEQKGGVDEAQPR